MVNVNFFIKVMILGCCLVSYVTPVNSQSVTIQDILISHPEYMSDTMGSEGPFASGSSGGQLTITGSGTIRFLQALFYSDTLCSTLSLLGTASVVDNVSGLVFTSGQTISVNPSSVYKLANNQSINTANIRCMKLFINGGNQSSNGVACQSFTDEICSGTTCTSGQSYSVTWGASPTACVTNQYVYVSNYTANTVFKCTINSNGTLATPCTTLSGTYTNPNSGAINNGRSYIANKNNGASVGVNICTVSAADGSFSGCSITTGFSTPSAVVLNGKYAYVTNNAANTVSQCTVSASSGALSDCTSTGSGFASPNQIAFNNGYAYIANNTGSNTVRLCSVSTSNGSLTCSSSTGSGFTSPPSVTIYNGYAYVSNNSTSLYKCNISAVDGTFSSCAATGGTSGTTFPSTVYGVAITNGYAYVVYGNVVYFCTVSSSDGSLTCTGGNTGATTGFSGASQPFIN